MSSTLTMTKHHGLGNDFLVLVDFDGATAGLDLGAVARAACDRRRGVGADGLLVATPGGAGADVRMELRNADGSAAEMSGNGIRCLAQAVWDGRRGPGTVLTIATAAGVRVVRRRPGGDGREVLASVDMGPVKVDADGASEWVAGTVERAALVDVGNPHLVLLDRDVAAVDVASRGPGIEAAVPGGINVEWIAPSLDGGLTLRVWERGAGETLACGTGSCAAAAAAAGWGLGGSPVVVHNPGGDVTVELGESAVLTGPAVLVARVELPWP